MKTTAHRGFDPNSRMSRRELKNLRYAEARHRFELQQEARTLEEHLADFWDERTEEKRRSYSRLTIRDSKDLTSVSQSDDVAWY